MSRPQEAAALRPQAERKTHPARAKRPKPVIPTETTLHPPSDVQKLPYPARLPKDEKDEVPGLRLDKSLFRKTLNLCAIKVPAKLSGELVRDERVNSSILFAPRTKPIIVPEDDPSVRLIQLNVESADELPAETHAYIQEKGYEVVSQPLVLDYDHWTADQVLTALLPEQLPEGTPTAFTVVGHIAHLNLREEYLPYRYIMGQVILEKNRAIRTVVNKLDSIDNEFRFFKMERLAGDDEYIVEASESNCTFTFDFRTVYWNSRLHTEHARLVDSFRPYEVISDVFAGVGPFAVPAAKKGCNVLANDLNPSSYESLVTNMKKNKVTETLRPSNLDGRPFIRSSILEAWQSPSPGRPLGGAQPNERKSSRRRHKEEHERRARLAAERESGAADSPASDPASTLTPPPPPPAAPKEIERVPPRKLIDHFVMNLPGTALEFLDAFRGAYLPLRDAVGEEALEQELERSKNDEVGTNANARGNGSMWPMVHVHCFTKDLERPYEDICERANRALGLTGPGKLVPPPSPAPAPASALSDESSAPSTAPTTTPTSNLPPATAPATSASRSASAAPAPTPELSLHLVRSVAPNKDMYCLSFRLSREVLFDL